MVLVLVAAGFGMDRAVGRPLARLREVVRRQAEEDVIAMANQEEGALEVRMLARDFNDLTRANARLVDQQAAVLEMQELVLDVGRGARSAVDVHEALQRVATKLGAGLGADRVLLYTARRRRPDDRGPPPVAHRRPARPAAAAAVPRAAGGRRQRRAAPGRRLLRPRRPARAPGLRGRTGPAFHRATGARSLLMVPVGTGGARASACSP